MNPLLLLLLFLIRHLLLNYEPIESNTKLFFDSPAQHLKNVVKLFQIFFRPVFFIFSYP